ncbi:MAG: hypothetical protein ACPGNV_03730 [Mangrovicoccus sp.]
MRILIFLFCLWPMLAQAGGWRFSCTHMDGLNMEITQMDIAEDGALSLRVDQTMMNGLPQYGLMEAVGTAQLIQGDPAALELRAEGSRKVWGGMAGEFTDPWSYAKRFVFMDERQIRSVGESRPVICYRN